MKFCPYCALQSARHLVEKIDTTGKGGQPPTSWLQGQSHACSGLHWVTENDAQLNFTRGCCRLHERLPIAIEMKKENPYYGTFSVKNFPYKIIIQINSMRREIRMI